MTTHTPYLIGIAGGSASGKTHLLRLLRQAFSEKEVCIISQDDYYKPVEDQIKDEKGFVNFDQPEAIDLDQFIIDVHKLSMGEMITRKEYTFNHPDKEPRLITFKPAPIVVVEGLFVLYSEAIKSLLNLKVFINANEEIKLQRRLKRDAEERAIPEEVILYQWHHHVYPAFLKYLLPHQREADIIITNNDNTEIGLGLLTDHIRAVLDESKSC